ncbi:fatty acyl-AMP ligase [Actinosynnema sp. NPDC050436]|uniref:fatty acyl-AMP ligase n=1 Tax=Actinosynnema sp. NPDC050436 TaxID=3155659 RepID=UPI0033C87DEA
MDRPTLPEVVMGHAQRFPGRKALVSVSYDGTAPADQVLTYGELHAAALSLGSHLRRSCEVGDRVLLLYPSGPDFLIAFLGCLYAGAVPVPAPLPTGPRHHLDRTTGIALDADVSAVLTQARDLVTIADWLDQDGIADLPVTATDVAHPGRSLTAPVRTDPGTTAYLQYSSGANNRLRGVVVTHDCLVDNLRLIQRTYRLTATDTFCTWLPLHSDLGLVASLLEPLHLGGTAVVMPPHAFVSAPHRWLELIDRSGATISFAPSSAFELCVRRVTDEQVGRVDLSRWRHACNGGEPIDPGTLAAFAARFAPARFRETALRPGYGLAEATLLVTGAGPDRAPTVVRVDPRELENGRFEPVPPGAEGKPLVSSGTIDGLDVRVVEPDLAAELPDGRLGEIWVRGGSVTAGYWRRGTETEAAFGGVLGSGEGRFLRTGDLGVRHGGELYVLGRLADMMFLQGRTLHPRDVEQAALAADGTSTGLAAAAFLLAGSRNVVVVQEVDADRVGRDGVARLADAVRRSVGRRMGILVSRLVFVPPGGLPRSTRGKVQRALVEELFLADALTPLDALPGPRTREPSRRPAPLATTGRKAG